MPEVPEEVTLVNKQFGCGIVGQYVFSEIPDWFLEARSNSVFFTISLIFFLYINLSQVTTFQLFDFFGQIFHYYLCLAHVLVVFVLQKIAIMRNWKLGSVLSFPVRKSNLVPSRVYGIVLESHCSGKWLLNVQTNFLCIVLETDKI